MASTQPLLAVQMYTLRDLTKDDMAGVLRQVNEIGYDGVELAGYGNLAPHEVKRTADELGLSIISLHVGWKVLQNLLPQIIEDCALFGNRFVAVSLSPQICTSAAEYSQAGRTLEVTGRRLSEVGVQLCHHNHAFEFEHKFDEGYGFDLIYENSDPQWVQTEIDTYWVKKGGEDPAQYIRKYSGRAPLLHIKDMAEDGSFAVVGTGVLDWDAILQAARESGVQAFIVEQDICPGNPLDSIRLSYENFRKMKPNAYA